MAVKFLAEYPYPETVPVIAEGDRLGGPSFFLQCQNKGVSVSVVLLDTPGPVAAARRAERGSNQNPVWLRGRATKVERVSDFVLPKWRLDGTLPVATLVEQLRSHPFLKK